MAARIRWTQISPPAGLDWQIAVPGSTEIGGRTFTVRLPAGWHPRDRLAVQIHQHLPRQDLHDIDTGQEGLDIVVDPPLEGPVQICIEPSEALRLEAGSRPLRLLRYDGTRWIELPTTDDGVMVCGTTSGFSAFVLGYEAPRPTPASRPAPTDPPESTQPIRPQSVLAGTTSALLT